MVLVVKNPPANAGDIRDAGSIPGSGRSPGEGNGNLLQYSCLENLMDSGAWWLQCKGLQRVGLKRLSTHREGGNPPSCHRPTHPLASDKTAIVQSVPRNPRKVLFSSSLSKTPSYSHLPETRTQTQVTFKQKTCEPMVQTSVEIS